MNIKQKFINLKKTWNLFTRKRKLFYLLCFALISCVLALPFFVQAGLDNLLMKFFASLLQLIAYALGFIVTKLMGILVFFATWSHYTTGITAVTEGWKISRDICNMFFIFILLIVSFATILGVESYSYKKWLSKIIVFAILINFSKTITGLLIDVSQVVMLTFVAGFKDATANNIAKGLNLGKFMSKNPSDPTTETGIDPGYDVFIAMLLVCIMLTVLCIVLLIMIVMLVGRILTLWILAILSPFAFLLQASPVGGKYASEWWQTLSKNLISGPILAMFIYLCLYTIQMSGTTNVSNMGESQDSIEGGFGSAPQDGYFAIQGTTMILDYIIVIAMLMAAIKISSSLGVMGSSFAGSMAGKLQNATKSALKLGAKGVGAVTGANWVAKRYKAYNEIKKDRKDMNAYRDAQKFMTVTGNLKERVGKKMQQPAEWIKKQEIYKRATKPFNAAGRARERAAEFANNAESLSFARSMGINSQNRINNVDAALTTRRSDSDMNINSLLNNVNTRTGGNVTDIKDLRREDLTEAERIDYDNFTQEREKIDKEQGNIDTLKNMYTNGTIDDNIMSNRDSLDKKINDFQGEAEKSGKKAQAWSDFGSGVLAILKRGLLATSFLTPLGAGIGMLIASLPGISQDIGKSLEKSGKADTGDAASFLVGKVKDKAKSYEDEDTGELRKKAKDFSNSINALGAKFELLNRGALDSKDIPQLRADLKELAADDRTIRAFEDVIRKQFPSEARWKDENGKVLRDGEREEKLVNVASNMGLKKYLTQLDDTAITEEVLRVATSVAKTPAELQSAIDSLSIAQQKAFAETTHRVIQRDGANMSIMDVDSLNKILKAFSSSVNSENDPGKRKGMSAEVFNTVSGRGDLQDVNFGELLVNMNLTDSGSNAMSDAQMNTILNAINPVEFTSAIKNAIDLGGEQKRLFNNFLERVHTQVGTNTNQNFVDITDRLKRMAKNSNNQIGNNMSNVKKFQ